MSPASIRIQLPPTLCKQSLIDSLQAFLEYPDYFGNNWDAVWDVLDEWLAQHPQPHCVVLDGRAVESAEPQAWRLYLAVLTQASTAWPHFSYQLEHCDPIANMATPPTP